jgi:hypothetical protein
MHIILGFVTVTFIRWYHGRQRKQVAQVYHSSVFSHPVA